MPAAATTWPTVCTKHRLSKLGPDDPGTLSTATTLASVLLALGRYGEARELGEDTLARYRRVLGDDHPNTMAAANNLASVLGPWASIRRPASCTRTPWPAVAACSATTTPRP